MLKSPVREVGFGGQAGGAKSFALVLDALYQLPKHGYNAILFRRTYKQLKQADSLIDLTKKVYPALGGTYNQSDYLWTFSDYHNNTIQLAHMEHDKNVEDYRGQYAWVGYDELQQFTERMYVYLFSRQRSSNADIDLYIRSAFNPGEVGHLWIKKRFEPHKPKSQQIRYFRKIDGKDTETNKNDHLAISRLFIQSRLEDNPYLWNDGNSEYEKGLHQLDSVDFRRLRHGDWDIRRTGLIYHAFNEFCLGPSSSELDCSQAEGYWHAHDFGAVNRAWLLFVRIKGIYYLIHEEILLQGTTAARATKILTHLANRKIIAGYGGTKSEKQQIVDYRKEGVKIRVPAISNVESQIDKTNKMFENGTLIICSDMTLTIDQLENCIRDAKEQVQDKSIWHFLDCLRYLAAGLSKRGWVR